MKHEYQLSTGVWVIGECERCGRGFIHYSVPVDGYPPATPKANVSPRTFFSHTRCGGQIRRLLPHPDNQGDIPVMQHD